ncbi:hypothetical protein GB928_002845 [Shinella curvata]|uniref:Transposase n=1 Tax=Shinella curvata TaxID=1817964 RepID=A0ABT8X8S1_9HYPH|nr:hypothetical protein [Shinella curvata]MCJ8051934.1 hypothetical protein [Shinella curvata]MDO6120118.1 hypothetical protein [Shinella curvata]
MIFCEKCDSPHNVKNGKVRGVQRYRCRDCKHNFVVDFKHRYPRDAKLLHLMIIHYGASEQFWHEDGPTAATVETWAADARQLADWFIRALADHHFFCLFFAREDFEKSYSGTVGLAAAITGNSGRDHLNRFMDLLDAEFAHICEIAEQHPEHEYYGVQKDIKTDLELVTNDLEAMATLKAGQIP